MNGDWRLRASHCLAQRFEIRKGNVTGCSSLKCLIKVIIIVWVYRSSLGCGVGSSGCGVAHGMWRSSLGRGVTHRGVA